MAPKQRVRAREGGTHHALADGFKDLCAAEIRDEQAEDVAAGGLCRGQNVGAGTGTPRDDTLLHELIDGLGDGNAGGAVAHAQLGFRGKLITGAESPGFNGAAKFVEDEAVFGDAAETWRDAGWVAAAGSGLVSFGS